MAAPLNTEHKTQKTKHSTQNTALTHSPTVVVLSYGTAGAATTASPAAAAAASATDSDSSRLRRLPILLRLPAPAPLFRLSLMLEDMIIPPLFLSAGVTKYDDGEDEECDPSARFPGDDNELPPAPAAAAAALLVERASICPGDCFSVFQVFQVFSVFRFFRFRVFTGFYGFYGFLRVFTGCPVVRFSDFPFFRVFWAVTATTGKWWA